MAQTTKPSTTLPPPSSPALSARSPLAADPGLGPGLVTAGSLAQPEPAVPEPGATQFVAVTGAEVEHTSAASLLVAAYALFWVLLLGFLYRTFRGQLSLVDRIQLLERKLDDIEALDPNPGSQKP